MGLVQSDVLTPSLMNGLFIIHVRVENLAEFMVAGRLEGYLNIIGSAIVGPSLTRGECICLFFRLKAVIHSYEFKSLMTHVHGGRVSLNFLHIPIPSMYNSSDMLFAESGPHPCLI